MKRSLKILTLIIVFSFLCTVATFSVSAEATAYTYTDIYSGEYETQNHSGYSYIVFGQVNRDATEYGITLTDEQGKTKQFSGKVIGEEGKFGIAIYNLPEGIYSARVYSGSVESRVYGDIVEVVNGETAPTVKINNAYAELGDETVSVEISVKNNPGISGLKIGVTYGDGLTLSNVIYGASFSGGLISELSKNPISLTWINYMAEISEDGVFVTLVFDISDSITEKTEIELSITEYPDDTIDFNTDNVSFTYVNGTVTIG